MKLLRNDKDNMVVSVSIFTIEGLEGGNNYIQFMAVFAALSQEAEDHPQKMNLLDVMAVGGKGLRSIEFKKIELNLVKGDIGIMVSTLEYGLNDAMCCPSIKSKAYFIIHPYVGDRLTENIKKTGK